ncbi:MAG TPA: class I SAM-dependent methyltransferase [Gaiellaceae bacterium]|nr:class I SAM-dependent methyltransferase [Gaiellaceae bacterium]
METTPRRLTFGAHADEYERARPEWPEEVARWFVPEGAQVVVELGAGTGKLTRAVAALGVRVIAVEPDPRMLAVLRAGGLEGVEGSAEAIPVEDGAADAVVAGSCVHWFDLDRALPEIDRVLRPGGRFGFGWNGRDGRHPTIARMNEAIYSQAPDRTRWRDRGWEAEVVAASSFRDVEHVIFEHVHELPREALDAHLWSYATIASLPGPQRERVFADVADVLDSDPDVSDGVRLRLPFAVHAYRATRG